MVDREKVISGWERCKVCDTSLIASAEGQRAYIECEYTTGLYCRRDKLIEDTLTLLKEQDEEHRRLLSWLGKFCRHIDNGDKWLTDEENIAFFKEKMKQQFGWNAD